MAFTLEQAALANPGIGRRRLMALTGRTAYACEKFLQAINGVKAPGKLSSKLSSVYGQKGPECEAAPEKAMPVGVPVKKFLARFDFESKLAKTVKDLCADRFVSDADIRSECGIPAGAYRDVAGLPQFQKCQIKDGGTLWWSSEENVDKVRAAARKWRISK